MSGVVAAAAAFLDRWGSHAQLPAGRALFLRLLGLWILLSAVPKLFQPEVFYATDSFIPAVSAPQGLREMLTELLVPAERRWLVPFFLGGQVATALLLATGRGWRLATAVCYLCTENLDSIAWTVLDGGDNLRSLLMVYAIAFLPPGAKNPGSLAVALSNAALWTARLQICLVYLTAALCKVNGHLWQSGMALFYVFQSDYSTPLWAQLARQAPAALTLATYGTIAFQLSFPVLVWHRRLRPWLLVAGVGLHAGIALVMGLFEFSLFMSLSYALFLRDAKLSASGQNEGRREAAHEDRYRRHRALPAGRHAFNGAVAGAFTGDAAAGNLAGGGLRGLPGRGGPRRGRGAAGLA